MTASRSWIALGAITLAGMVWRCVDLTRTGLWLDEAQSWHWAVALPSAMVGRASGLNPPLFGELLQFWIRLFGDGEVALRSLPVLLGTLAIPFVAMAGRRLFDDRTGLLAAGIVAFSRFPVHYAQDVRPYSLLLLASAASGWAYLEWRRSDSRNAGVTWIVATIVLLYAHSFGVLGLLAQHLHRAATDRARPRYWWRAQMIVVAALIPWIPHALRSHGHLLRSGFWIEQPDLADLSRAFQLLTAGTQSIGWMLPLLGLALLGVAASRRRNDANRPELFVALGISLPILVSFAGSQFLTPFFWPRYLIGSIPWLSLAVARGCLELPGRALKGVGLAYLGIVSIVAWQTDRHREDGPTEAVSHQVPWPIESWREAVERIESEGRPGDVVVVAPEYARPAFDYYARDRWPAHEAPSTLPDDGEKQAILEALTDIESGRIWLLVREHRYHSGQPIEDFLVESGWHAMPTGRSSHASPRVWLFSRPHGGSPTRSGPE